MEASGSRLSDGKSKPMSRTMKVLESVDEQGKEWHNWAGNVSQKVRKWVEPRSEEEIVETVSYALAHRLVVRVIGVGHSFNEMNCSADGIGMSMMFYKRILSLDKQRGTVTCQAGINLVLLIEQLEEQGFTLPNMPIVNSVTLGGALSTCSHGSGAAHPCLSDLMIACRLVDGRANVVEISESGENSHLLPAVRVSLGALGIFSTITLKVVPKFDLHVRELGMPLDLCLAHLEELKSRYEYFKAWWVPHTGKVHAFLIDRDATTVATPNEFEENCAPDEPLTEEEADFIHSDAGSRFENDMYLLCAQDPPRTPFVNNILRRLLYTPKMTVAESSSVLVNGHWASGNESKGCRFDVLEYTLPADALPAALREFSDILDQLAPEEFLGFPVDIRFSKADDAWLSPAFGMDVAWLGIPAKRPYGQSTPHDAAFRAFEEVMVKHGGRPHWAKQHCMGPAFFKKSFPHWQDFLTLRQQMDPSGVFLNEYLATTFGISKQSSTPVAKL